jgi:hypothetical protein
LDDLDSAHDSDDVGLEDEVRIETAMLGRYKAEGRSNGT